MNNKTAYNSGKLYKMLSYRRDRAAGCVIVFAKSRTGRQWFTDITGLSSTIVI